MNDAKNYVQVRLELMGFDPEVLPAILFQNGCQGIEEVSENIWFAYFPGDFSSAQLSGLLNQLRQVNPAFHPEQFVATVLPDEDWNAAWKKHFRPLRVGEHIWVAPPWDLPEVAEDQQVIIIDPQMAFGTGSHETTRLMVQALEKYLRPGQSVLDAGTGSGILAIIARKLGAGRVVGFDVEEESIENAEHNAGLNRTEGIEFRLGDQSVIPPEEFDLVLANINRAVLVEMLPDLNRHLKSGGVLVLSGILKPDETLVRAAAPLELTWEESLRQKEWSALIFHKQASNETT